MALDPLGGISVAIDSVPQGQGHQTVVAQVVGEVFGLPAAAIRVDTELDTGKDAWSIAAGNYSSRFAGAVVGAVHLAALRLRGKVARVAAAQLNIGPDQVRFAGGKVFAAANPDNAIAFARLAGTSHWSPERLADPDAAALRETVFWTPLGLDPPSPTGEINSSAAYGFIFDFCGVEIDRDTGEVHFDKYVTMHDAGRILNPALFDGQVLGGFAHGVGAALYEELVYGEDGGFLSGSFADYSVPSACEIPQPVILHRETASPVTPLGATDLSLPLTPQRVAAWLRDPTRLPRESGC